MLSLMPGISFGNLFDFLSINNHSDLKLFTGLANAALTD